MIYMLLICYIYLYCIYTIDPAQYINEYGSEVKQGSCANSFYDAGFDNVAGTPPLALTERYYECTLTVFDAGFEALGLSLGNAEVFVMILMTFICGFVSFFIRCFNGYRDGVFEDYEVCNTEYNVL